MSQNNEQEIRAAITSSMGRLGWQLHAVCQLPEAFCKGTVVTPYFFCSGVSLKPYGKYTIEGALGVVHRGFEFSFSKDFPLENGHGFAVQMNLLNFRDLRRKRYLAPGAEADEVEQFCIDVVKALGRMPADEAKLVESLERNELCGFPWNAYSGYAYRSKFLAFTDFVEHLRKRRDSEECS